MRYVALLLATLARAFRSRRDLLIENPALRQQLAVYTRSQRHPPPRATDGRFWSARPPSGPRELPPSSARDRMVAEPILGGLHHLYRWAA